LAFAGTDFEPDRRGRGTVVSLEAGVSYLDSKDVDPPAEFGVTSGEKERLKFTIAPSVRLRLDRAYCGFGKFDRACLLGVIDASAVISSASRASPVPSRETGGFSTVKTDLSAGLEFAITGWVTDWYWVRTREYAHSTTEDTSYLFGFSGGLTVAQFFGPAVTSGPLTDPTRLGFYFGFRFIYRLTDALAISFPIRLSGYVWPGTMMREFNGGIGIAYLWGL
jgi:hypothetical protein